MDRPRCHRCNKMGHRIAQCPQAAACHRCGETGHKMAECTKPIVASKCHRCGEEGHKMAECTKPIVASKCHRCGEEGHKMAECTRPVVASKCHRCGEPGHKMADCKSGIEFKCHRCGGVGHKLAECPSNRSSNAILKNMLTTRLVLANMWGANSALISTDCDLSKLKLRFIDALIKADLLTVDEADERNRTSHIDIKGDQQVYNQLNNCSIIVCNTTLQFEKNYVAIRVANKYHVTLVFKRDIVQHSQRVVDILDSIIADMSTSQEETVDDRLTCCICLVNSKTIKLSPCNHICLCQECFNHGISRCPICRSHITGSERVYL